MTLSDNFLIVIVNMRVSKRKMLVGKTADVDTIEIIQSPLAEVDNILIHIGPQPRQIDLGQSSVPLTETLEEKL